MIKGFEYREGQRFARISAHKTELGKKANKSAFIAFYNFQRFITICILELIVT